MSTPWRCSCSPANETRTTLSVMIMNMSGMARAVSCWLLNRIRVFAMYRYEPDAQLWIMPNSCKTWCALHYPLVDRIRLVQDNLNTHTPGSFYQILPPEAAFQFAQRFELHYTPKKGRWLNMAESIQRILADRALSGQHPSSAQQIIDWLEATARGWNGAPTPFVWGGKRQGRRQRARQRRYILGGSGACTLRRVPCHHDAKPERLCA